MKRRYLLHIVFVSFALLLCNPFPVKGAEGFPTSSQTFKDMLSGNAGNGSVCSSVKQAVELGHNACLVIKCAVMSGGNLEDVINGATDAGVTSDVVARCCIDAGAGTGEVAKSLARVNLPGLCYGLGYSEEGLGYSEPAQPITMPDIPSEPPVISPHTF